MADATRSPNDSETPDEFTPHGVTDLCNLLDALDLLDQLTQLPAGAGSDRYVAVGRFLVRQRLGSGRYGLVFLADDPVLLRPVVIKVPQPAILADPDLRARFHREAVAAGRLDHPGIVPVHDTGEYRGIVYLAAGLVRGPTLAEWLARNPAPQPRTVARVLELLSRAVQHAHERGVLHCDLKPANVLLDTSGTLNPSVPGVGVPRVTDFGLARLLTADESARPQRSPGTPLYMAPEQGGAGPHDVTQQSDVYALGAILYELLTGRPPLVADRSSEIRRQVAGECPTPPRRLRADVPRDLEAVCLKCLAKRPGDRYDSAGQLADDLARHLAGLPVRALQYRAWERAVLWAVRRPELAALVSVVGIFVLTACASIAYSYRQTRTQNLELTRQLEREQEQDRLLRMALGREQEARQRARVQRYAGTVARAADCWEAGRADLLREPLAEARPGPGEEDYREFTWYFLSLRSPEKASLRGHQDTVVRLAAHPGSRRFASGSRDGTVVLWGGEAGGEMVELGRLPRSVSDMVFSADGSRLLAFSPDPDKGHLLRVWDVRAGRALADRAEPDRSVTAPGFTSDGRFVAYARKSPGGAEEVVLWEPGVDDPRVVRPDGRTDAEVLSCRPDLGFSAVQTRVETRTGFRRDLEQRPLTPGVRSRPTFTGLPDRVRYFAYSRDGSHAACACEGGAVVAWDATTGRERFRGSVPADSARDLAISAGGRVLAVAWGNGAGSRIESWNLATGRPLGSIRPQFSAYSLAFVSDDILAAGLVDSTVRLWDLEPRPPSRTLQGRGAEVWSVAFSPDGSTLAAAGDDHVIRLWDVARGEHRATLIGHESLVMSVAYAPDGKSLVSGGFDGTVRLWDGDASTARQFAPPHTEPVTSAAVSPDGASVASRGRDGAVRIWDRATARLLHSIPGNRGKTGWLAFSPDGRTLAVASAEDGTRLWDADAGRLTRVLHDPNFTWSVAYSPDGRTLATSSANGEVRLYPASGGEPRLLQGHDAGVGSVAFSPDGRTLATGGGDGTIRLWHVPTGQPLVVLRGHRGRVFSVCFSPDGRTLASGGHDGTVQLWEASDPLAADQSGVPAG